MYYKSPLTYILVLLFILITYNNLIITKEQQFVLLAESFKVGSLAFTHVTNVSDTALYNSQYFWPHGPFPALIITPFLFISNHFFQGFISAPLIFLTFLILYKLARFLQVDHKKSLLLAIFFVFGSIYTPVAAIPATSYYSQSVAACFLVLALYEFLKRKGFVLSGIYFACAFASRFNIIFGLAFFIYLLFKEKKLVVPLVKFLLPVFAGLLLLASYNYARFENPLETGYNLQLIHSEALLRRNEGLFSLKHVPANIYFMIFRGPDPILRDQSYILKYPYLTFDSHGLSLFFLSPILLFVFKADFKKSVSRASLIAVALIGIPIITYYGIGYKQVGYRYALDLFPFVYLLVADAARKINYKLMIILVFWGVFFSLFFTFLYFTGQEH